MSLEQQYAVFQRVALPDNEQMRDPGHWTSLIEQGLPEHLQTESVVPPVVKLSISDIADLCLVARGVSANPKHQVDVLCHLAVVENRWSAVTWLVKELVGRYPQPNQHQLSRTLSPWQCEGSLDSMSAKPITLPTSESVVKFASSLHDLTGSRAPERMSRQELRSHDVIGSIWRSLAAMVAVCVDSGIVRPEILEIIAHLHHREVIPASIYSHKPVADQTVVQQPPTLHLLSSRILTSLSDAAWRAHENTVVAEAKSGGMRASARPELPGTAYRINVAGLRPEIWIELILWSCLHGGWIEQGADILRALHEYNQESIDELQKWKPLSWRSLMPASHANIRDWDGLDHLFNTNTKSTMDEGPLSNIRVNRTVSSEVVNAYVDAVLLGMDNGVGVSGLAPRSVMQDLRCYQDFLGRSHLKLGGGSWEAMVLRFLDQSDDQFMRFHAIPLTALCIGFGGYARSDTTSKLPPYVLDGSALVIGLFHRSLQIEIAAGNVHGALLKLTRLQKVTDENKQRSIAQFLRAYTKGKRANHGSQGGVSFTDNYAGIDYPAFDVQIPFATLGSLMNLFTSAKAYDLGTWLLTSKFVDGPLIPESLYTHESITPALIRFATETDNRELLGKLVVTRTEQNISDQEGPMLPHHVALSFLHSQMTLYRWTPTIRLLEYIRDALSMYPSPGAFAVLLRSMLRAQKRAQDSVANATDDLGQAQAIFRDMVSGKYGLGDTKRPGPQIVTIVLILSTLDTSWARFSLDLLPMPKYWECTLRAKTFNIILEGVVEAYGAAAGRKLLGIFWPHSVRSAQRRVARMSRYRPSPLDKVNRQRTIVHVPGPKSVNVVMYGGLRPDLQTIRIVLHRALEDIKQDTSTSDEPYIETESRGELDGTTTSQDDALVDLSPKGMLTWAVRCMLAQGMSDEAVQEELEGRLSKYALESLRPMVPSVCIEAASDYLHDSPEERTTDPQLLHATAPFKSDPR